MHLALVAIANSEQPRCRNTPKRKESPGWTYRGKFAIDILDQEGAELRKDLEECWL